MGVDGGAGGGDPTCHLMAATGEEQKSRKPLITGDCRYTSGYLVHPHGTGSNAAWEAIALALAIGAVYCVGGVAFNAAVAREVGEPKPVSALLPHAEFWAELGGLVIDGVGFTMGRRPSKPADGPQVARLSDGLINQGDMAR